MHTFHLLDMKGGGGGTTLIWIAVGYIDVYNS